MKMKMFMMISNSVTCNYSFVAFGHKCLFPYFKSHATSFELRSPAAWKQHQSFLGRLYIWYPSAARSVVLIWIIVSPSPRYLFHGSIWLFSSYMSLLMFGGSKNFGTGQVWSRFAHSLHVPPPRILAARKSVEIEKWFDAMDGGN